MEASFLKPEIKVAASVLIRPDGCFLLARKKRGLSNGGLWEFPGGKIEDGESPLQALERELSEEMDLAPGLPSFPLLEYSWENPSSVIHFHFFVIQTTVFSPQSSDHDAFAWIVPGEPITLDVVEADQKALAFLHEHPENLTYRQA